MTNKRNPHAAYVTRRRRIREITVLLLARTFVQILPHVFAEVRKSDPVFVVCQVYLVPQVTEYVAQRVFQYVECDPLGSHSLRG